MAEIQAERLACDRSVNLSSFCEKDQRLAERADGCAVSFPAERQAAVVALYY
jgi:hypothetical protein